MSIKHSKLYQFVNKNAATLGLITSILAISTAAIFIRKAQEHMPSLVIATYRLLLATLLLLPFSIKSLRQDRGKINRKNLPLLLLSGVLLALHFASWIKSLEYANVVPSVVLVTTTPVWVTLLSPIFLKEKLPKAFTVGLVVAFFGMLLVSISSVCSLSLDGFRCDGFSAMADRRGLLGNLLALMGAWFFAGYMIVGRKIRKEISNQSVIIMVYAIAGLSLLLISLLTRQPLGDIQLSGFKWIVILALVPQIIGHSLLSWALGRLPAAYVSLSLLGEPIGSAILALLFLGEIPTPLEVLGSAVIIFGIYWANKPRGNSEGKT